MAIRTELNLRLPNSPGALNEVCRALADERDVLVTPRPNTPGGLAPVLALARDAGINIEYAYSAAPASMSAGL